MIQGWVMAWAGRRVIQRNVRNDATMPVSHGAHRAARPAGRASPGPGDPAWRTRRSGTSPTKTRSHAPAFGKARLRRIPETAARASPRGGLMKANLPARLGGLIDRVDDLHERHALVRGHDRLLAQRDAADEVIEFRLVR